MADMEQMLNVQRMASQGNSPLTTGGTLVGGAVGTFFGSPTTGAAVGAAVGTLAASLMPQYSHVRGSLSGINFVKKEIKPYMLTVIEPDMHSARQINDYYCYFGCKTARTETLDITNYMYDGHAYVKGYLHYNGTIPMDKFIQIREMFARGVHILDT